MTSSSSILEEIIAAVERVKKEQRVLVCSPGREEALRELCNQHDLDIEVRPSLMVEGNTVYVIGRVNL